MQQRKGHRRRQGGGQPAPGAQHPLQHPAEEQLLPHGGHQADLEKSQQQRRAAPGQFQHDPRPQAQPIGQQVGRHGGPQRDGRPESQSAGRGAHQPQPGTARAQQPDKQGGRDCQAARRHRQLHRQTGCLAHAGGIMQGGPGNSRPQCQRRKQLQHPADRQIARRPQANQPGPAGGTAPFGYFHGCRPLSLCFDPDSLYRKTRRRASGAKKA